MNTKRYYKSLAHEITAVKDRVQILIGKGHWQTVGSWKESVLRSILRRHIPSSFQIGSGFVLSEYGISTQIDILIYDDSGPVLFRDGDLVIVTPDIVRAAIEVKTRIKRSDLKEVIQKITRVGGILERKAKHPYPFFGIFSYEEEPLDGQFLLNTIKEVNSERGLYYEIKCISLGMRQFVRFWEFPPTGIKRLHRRWHCYDLDRIAQAYFVHNVIEHLFPDSIERNNSIWYPVDGKKSQEISSIAKDA